MSHARRTYAGFSEPVVEPSGSAIPEVGAKRLMNRAEHLKEHEDRTDKCERARERIAALYGADERAHGDRKRRRQDPSQRKDGPPAGGEGTVSLGQDAEEFPCFALGE